MSSAAAAVIQPSKLLLDIVRIKKLPQGEDEPLPCSAAVHATIVEIPTVPTITTDVQKGTNNPYFNQTTERELPSTAPDTMTFLVEVVEHARGSSAQTILYAQFTIDQAVASGLPNKTELSLILTEANPLSAAAVAQAQLAKLADAPDAPTLVVRYRLIAPKHVKPAVDPNADAVLDALPELTGDHRLVPKVSPLAWISLVSDAAWCDRFAACVVETWKHVPSLSVQIHRMASAGGGDVHAPQPKKPAGSKGGATPRGSSAGGGVKSMSDVIFQSWCCKRSHQLLSRLRFSAEMFVNGSESMVFTLEDELKWKQTWKERSVLRMQQCRRCFEPAGAADKLRTMLDRLWMLMVAGIPAEGPAPNLPFDVRHKLNQATFTTTNAETLQACLLHRVVPWLSYTECEQLAKDDADLRALPSSVRGAAFPPVVADAKAAHQIAFVDQLASFVGRLVDSLTDTEFGTALEYFVPAVREAHMRSFGGTSGAADLNMGGSKKSRGGSGKKKKKESKGAGAADEVAAASPEKVADGVTIKHLDKLGRRTDEPKFA